VHARVTGKVIAGLLHHPADGAVGHGILFKGDVAFRYVAIEGTVDGEECPRREVVQPELLAVFEAEAVKLRSLVVSQGIEIAPREQATAGR
jgi:hypothetical protein